MMCGECCTGSGVMVPSASDVASFLAEYAAALLGCGATCTRIEMNVGRIGAAYGYDADVTMLPSHVEVAVTPAGGMSPATRCGDVAVRRIRGGAIRFSVNASLSRLSWDIADNGISLDDAWRRFGAIVSRPAMSPRAVLLLTSCANASFCRLFGGDAAAVAVVFVATLIGFRIRQLMLSAGCDVRLTFTVAAFVSATLSAADSIFGLGSTPQVAVATSVLYLVPGVPYINVVSDLTGHHYLCAYSRLVDAVILTVCLSLGLSAGIGILGIDN